MKELDAQRIADVVGGADLLTDALAPDPTPTEWSDRWDYPAPPTPL